jgi:hypothetical protein
MTYSSIVWPVQKCFLGSFRFKGAHGARNRVMKFSQLIEILYQEMDDIMRRKDLIERDQREIERKCCDFYKSSRRNRGKGLNLQLKINNLGF